MKKRHPNHDEIVEDLLDRIPWKVIAWKRKAPLATISDISGKFIDVIKVKKFDPGEGQLNFFPFWNTK